MATLIIIGGIIIGIVIISIIIFNSGGSSGKTPTETEPQRQDRIRREHKARERQAVIDRQNQLEREQQATLQRQQAQAEQQRQQAQAEQQSQQAERDIVEEQRRFVEQQQQAIERQRQLQQVAAYKPNWQDFQRILQQNGVTKLYHFTDRANLPSIRNNGGLYSWWKADELGIEIPMPGGIGFGRDLDSRYSLQNYVRLCFTRQHPMLYVAKREGRILNPVILEIKLDASYLKETRFSNMNATKTGHQQGLTLADLERIRFDLAVKPNHFDISDNEKHFYQAEILVLEKVPLEYITNINNV